jgi:hypothetical protein
VTRSINPERLSGNVVDAFCPGAIILELLFGCPKGCRAEDGPIDARYELKKTPSPEYEQRTEWNARN